jgi:magnesium transporter
MRQATKLEVCHDEGQAMSSSALRPSIRRFGRQYNQPLPEFRCGAPQWDGKSPSNICQSGGCRMSEVTAAIFRNGKVLKHVALDASMPQEGQSEFIWIEVLDPVDRDFAVLQERFRLHTLAIEDSMSPAQMPKVDIYDGQIFIVLKIVHLEEGEIKYTEINAFVSLHHIITVRRGDNAEYVLAREKFQSGPKSTQLGPDFILHAIMSFVADSYFPVVQMIEDEVLSMEQQALDAFLDRQAIARLFRLRREAIHLQHALTKMSVVCGKLINLNVPCIGDEVKPYFRDVHDHLIRLDTMISGLVDVIRAVFEASNLLEQQRQGVIIRQLAAWAAILGVPTAIAGIYGMNFTHMPELHAPYGYPIAIGAMLSICVALYVRFKKLRWL